jgi:triphosphoribosyl-dephospho-CoA synthetase
MNPETMLGAFATLASAWEVQVGPKPGLVDRFGSGAHRDMDYLTFLISTCALSPYWPLQARVGLDGTSPENAMGRLRETGLEMERAMVGVTGGVNTHKGLIFALSLLLFGAGYCFSSTAKIDPPEAARLAAEAVKEKVRSELNALSRSDHSRVKTHGEKLFLEYGITGIRGEASSGFPSVLSRGLPALHQALEVGASFHDAALYALFSIAAVCEDSNVITRGGFDFWRDSHRSRMQELATECPPYSPAFIEGLRHLDAEYSSLGVSPGGAADLLSCTLFLYWGQLVNKRELS